MQNLRSPLQGLSQVCKARKQFTWTLVKRRLAVCLCKRNQTKLIKQLDFRLLLEMMLRTVTSPPISNFSKRYGNFSRLGPVWEVVDLSSGLITTDSNEFLAQMIFWPVRHHRQAGELACTIIRFQIIYLLRAGINPQADNMFLVVKLTGTHITTTRDAIQVLRITASVPHKKRPVLWICFTRRNNSPRWYHVPKKIHHFDIIKTGTRHTPCHCPRILHKQAKDSFCLQASCTVAEPGSTFIFDRMGFWPLVHSFTGPDRKSFLHLTSTLFISFSSTKIGGTHSWKT